MKFDPQSVRLMRSVAVTLLVIFVMWIAGDLLKPIALAVLLAFILNPLVLWFDRRGVPRVASTSVTLLLVLGGVGLGGYFVSQQFLSLAADLPSYQSNIIDKLSALRPGPDSPIDKAAEVAEKVNQALGEDKSFDFTPKVRVVEDSGLLDQALAVFGPFKEVAGWGAAILLLLFFLLISQEEVSDRIVKLAGRGQISLTSKSMAMIAKRLSRYIAAFAFFNAVFGLVIGLMLYLIGLPYAALWGSLAAVLRFIPYLGPVLAFSLPTVFAFAHDPGWFQPAMVVVGYGLAEIIANSVEPIFYGRTVGVSSLGLLVSAMFWTWLWGGLGLLLATPLTVCLIVIGKHVKGLSFLDTLLEDKIEVEDDLRFYQRLQSRDREGAIESLKQATAKRPLAEVCDQIVVPSMSRTNADWSAGVLEPNDVVFHWSVIQGWLDALEQSPESVKELVNGSEREMRVVGVATNGVADVLVLRMLALLMKPTGIRFTILEGLGPPLLITQKVAEFEPDVVVVSYLPPLGLRQTRYLVKRLRAGLAGKPIVVGYWDWDASLAKLHDKWQVLFIYQVVKTLSGALSRLQALDPATTDRPAAVKLGSKPMPLA